MERQKIKAIKSSFDREIKQMSNVHNIRQTKNGLISFSSFQMMYLLAMIDKKRRRANAKVTNTLKLVIVLLIIMNIKELQKE